MLSSGIIDADSHVEEAEETWGYLEPAYQERRPRVVLLERGPSVTHQNAFWLVDGVLHPQPFGHGATVYGTPVISDLSSKEKPYSVESQTLRNIEARLHDLDKLKIETTVLFPTALLAPLTEDICFETALIRSYNTWLAERCRQAPDRLKWAAVLPIREPAEAASEVKRAKQLGAVSVMIPGTAGSALLHESQFDQIYAELERQDMPLCIHVGWSHPGLTMSCNSLFASHALSFTLPVLMAFFSITGGGVLERFPRLRVSFFEAGGDWIPWMVERMDRYFEVTSFHQAGPLPIRPPSSILKEGRVFFTVEGDETLLPTVLDFVGEGQIMASADMPHTEGRENCLVEIQERNDISERVKQKILSDNPRQFYGL